MMLSTLPAVRDAKLPDVCEYAGRMLPVWRATIPTFYGTPSEAMESYLVLALSARAYAPESVPGVYGFWFGGRCLYVGQSTNLRQRLASHEKKRTLPFCEIRWLACKNHKMVEKWLIMQFEPSCNGGYREMENDLIEPTEEETEAMAVAKREELARFRTGLDIHIRELDRYIEERFGHQRNLMRAS